MKTIKGIFLFGMLLLGCISCKNKADNAAQGADAKAESDSLHHAQGIVIDATMNGFTIVTPKSDTLFISTMDRDIALEGGLLLGDTLDVCYTVTEGEPGINMASAVEKVH
ncbi:MAG: hypothetical protein LUE99_07935 [Bacteroides sp.]|nr:hypothetical protein [Bacteroides sp.]